jgi:phosphate/sulfate permease
LEIDFLLVVVAVVTISFMVWNCIEVGSNDAANLVNAVFGARVFRRKMAVNIAGLFVILGAICASPVMDTVRKGIFDISLLSTYQAVSIFLAAYLVNAILLYAYSGYGIPVSTTATLVFSLAGGALGVVGELNIIKWSMLSNIVLAIFSSVFLSALVAFSFQRLCRLLIGFDCSNQQKVLLHGPWISGLICINLVWFMVIRGFNLICFDCWLEDFFGKSLGVLGFLLCGWGLFALVIWVIAFCFKNYVSKYLFHITSVLGMACMAFAFGQNDLANCASPGLAIYLLLTQGVSEGSSVEVPFWGLLSCGILIFLGMRTTRAQRVTRSEVNTASQQSKIKLYAPEWCCYLSRLFLRSSDSPSINKKISERDDRGKKKHYDTLRASIILSVSGSVIAAASSLGLPISTTYVSFAAVVATGWADKVFDSKSSDLKLGRTIWVVASWFIGSVIAFVFSMGVAFVINRYEVVGIFVILIINFVLHYLFKQRADSHEKMYHIKKNKKIIIE